MKYNYGYDGDSLSLLARAESSHDVVDVDAGADNVHEDDLSGAYLFRLARTQYRQELNGATTGLYMIRSPEPATGMLMIWLQFIMLPPHLKI